MSNVPESSAIFADARHILNTVIRLDLMDFVQDAAPF